MPPDYRAVDLIVVVIIVLIIACFFIFIVVAFANQRKRIYMEEKSTMELTFQQELLKTQLEIQEQTFMNISQEIHDNIGQVLSLAKINLATIQESQSPAHGFKINDTRTLITQAIQDLRDLSKTINPDYIIEMGLARSIEGELEKVNKTGIFQTSFQIDGDIRRLGSQKELILFRIVQELLNNAMKHSQAKNVEVLLTYFSPNFELNFTDDGLGFDNQQVTEIEKPGLGMKNIRTRLALIGGAYVLQTSPGKGTSITISLKEV